MDATDTTGRNTMRAIEIREFGDPQVLHMRYAPVPSPTTGQVLIEVAAADVMFLDARLRSGWGTDHFKMPLPYTPGGGVGGTIVEVADDRDRSLSGRRVISKTAASGVVGGLPIGGYAEFTLARADVVVPIPDDLAIEDATALVHDGRTALAAFDTAGVTPGDRVLITGAAGGLGTLLTQLSRNAGAEVIAGVSSAPKAQLSTALGATATVRYDSDSWPERVREVTGADGVDVVFDAVGGSLGAIAAAALRPGGRFLGYGSASGTFADIQNARRDASVTSLRRLTIDASIDWQALAHRAVRMAADGELKVHVGQTFPLADAAAAHTMIESRAGLGRTLLLMAP